MKKNLVLAVLLVSSFMATLVLTFPAKVSAKTIVVPTDYGTLQGAIDNAQDGDTLLIKAGTYEGPINQSVVIDKKLSIVGEQYRQATIMLYPAYKVTWLFATPFFSYTDAITISADDCRILNLTIQIANPGGFITALGDRTEIVGNNMMSGPTTYVKVNGSNCKITDNVMGGLVQLNGTFNEVSRNSIYGIWVYGSSNLVQLNSLQFVGLGNSTNNFVLGNTLTSTSRAYSGIDLTFSSNNFICRNRLSGFSTGLRLWYSPGNTIAANTVADSLTSSLDFGASSSNRIYLNNFVDNQFTFTPYVRDDFTDPNYPRTFPDMVLSTNYWDNGTRGNYWGNYNVSDANGDGLGDMPYVINANNRDKFPLMAQVNIDSINIDLPQWTPPSPSPTTLITPSQLPSSSPAPSLSGPPTSSSFTPTPSLFPTLQPSGPTIPPLNDSTPAPPPSPTPPPTQEPTSTPNTQPENFTPTIVIIVLVISVVVVAVLVYSAKHRGKK